ncbi:MAG TPA: carboxypeptidase-like regulatory domain-containing protein [Gaiellaceae bacterium]|nr:carboxypeptidase-like regulatory domain-containing protein [Gaiellaceae bacterium]
MKSLLSALVLALASFFLLAAGGSIPSGLRGKVLIAPSSPLCRPGMSCSRPAAHAVLRFSRNGKLIARTRTDGSGRYRIALRPQAYTVTAAGRGFVLEPGHVTVATGRYRRVTFKIDTGIR